MKRYVGQLIYCVMVDVATSIKAAVLERYLWNISFGLFSTMMVLLIGANNPGSCKRHSNKLKEKEKRQER